MNHIILLSEQRKEQFFDYLIRERMSVSVFTDEDQVVDFVRQCRVMFRVVYGRDVTGDFIRRRMEKHGIERGRTARTQKKFDFAFNLMDRNDHFRHNKSALRMAVENEFGEKILNTLFDEIWDSYHERPNHPKPQLNVDIHGQKSLF